jgi:hypothetical protein
MTSQTSGGLQVPRVPRLLGGLSDYYPAGGLRNCAEVFPSEDLFALKEVFVCSLIT